MDSPKNNLILHPEFDSGYPTESTLEIIKNWPFKDKSSFRDLLEYVREAWQYPNYFEIKPDLANGLIQYHISCGGWSGNEDLICALMNNNIFWALCWVQSRRGGHYIFEIKI